MEEEEEVEEEEEEEEEESSHSSPRSKQSKSKSDKQSNKQSEPKSNSESNFDPSEHYESSLTAIAVNCEKIIENPSTGVVRSHRQPSALSQVLAFLKDRDPRLRRIALLSLLKVFNDILPVPSRGNSHVELPHPPRHRRRKSRPAQARSPANPTIRGKSHGRLHRTASEKEFPISPT